MPSRPREVATKYDVDRGVSVPDLSDLPKVARVEGPTTFRLEASDFDTPDLALGRRGMTLRRRSGGPDEGCYLKLPDGGERHEIRAPLGRNSRTPPAALRRIVQDAVRHGHLEPVATLSIKRTVLALLDADGDLLAELCDDSVVGVRPGPNGEEEHAWREWELKTHGAQHELTRSADARIRQAGARPGSHASMVGRALDFDSVLDASRPPARRKRASERA